MRRWPLPHWRSARVERLPCTAWSQTILLDPLPIVNEEQVGVLWFSGSWREQEFLRLRPNFPGFQRMAAYRPDDVTLESAGQPLRLIPGIAVSSELFEVLGTPAMLGRTFRPGEDLVGAEPVAVLSHSLWEELGRDPNIVGKPLQLGGVARTVVGVMPQGFWFPSPTTRVWTAAQMNPDNRSGRYTLVGRVAEGQSLAQHGRRRSARSRTCSRPTSSIRIPSGTRRAILRSLPRASSSSAT